MKRILLVILVCFTLVFSGGLAMALYLVDDTDVGDIDSIYARTSLTDSGETSEIDWVNGVLGLFGDDAYTADDFTKEENLTGQWLDVFSSTSGVGVVDNVYAYSLDSTPPPEYFLLKLGDGNYSGYSHNLYTNADELEWAVIDLAVLGGEPLIGITRISHVSEFNGAAPVPEPATMLLFGTGLIGLAGLRARKKN